MLEGVDTQLRECLLVLLDGVVPPGHSDVEAVVARGLARPVVPALPRLHEPLALARDHEVHQHRRASRLRRRKTRVEVVDATSAHERDFHVGLRVDASGHDVAAVRVDDLHVHSSRFLDGRAV